MKGALIVLALLIGAAMGSALVLDQRLFSYQQKRGIVLENMMAAIEHSVSDGDYRCCIEPACTMCFLGEWMWDDGICRCDDLIREGNFDQVCPQCKSQIAQGKCKSSLADKCELV